MELLKYIGEWIRRQNDKHGFWTTDNHDKEIEGFINAMSNVELIQWFDMYAEEHLSRK